MSRYAHAWVNFSRHERGVWIRQSLSDCLGNKEKLADLFNLTTVGVDSILAGADWHPAYERAANPVSVEGT